MLDYNKEVRTLQFMQLNTSLARCIVIDLTVKQRYIKKLKSPPTLTDFMYLMLTIPLHFHLSKLLNMTKVLPLPTNLIKRKSGNKAGSMGLLVFSFVVAAVLFLALPTVTPHKKKSLDWNRRHRFCSRSVAIISSKHLRKIICKGLSPLLWVQVELFPGSAASKSKWEMSTLLLSITLISPLVNFQNGSH